MWFVVAPAALGALAALLLVAWRRGRLALAFLVITLVLGSAWTLSKIAIDHGYRGASGYGDCWPGCTAVQNAVGLGIGGAFVAWILLGAFAAVLAALSGPRGREWKPLR